MALTWMDAFCAIAFIAAFGGVLFGLDDLWIDIYAFAMRLGPRELKDSDLTRMASLPQKSIGIIIANWQEDEVLEPMVAGNVGQLKYERYTFFLGVYPNDLKTKEAAQRLERLYPQVKCIVNSKEGPTTKGQMLNEIARGILRHERESGIKQDLFLMQDSEDVLHPLSLQLINEAAEKADFVQIPVFSFDVSLGKLVAATYIDEFSEIHTKDLLVREKMGAAIPSAGVGTALSRRLVLANMGEQGGNLLREDTLTEDYDLGLNAKLRGMKSRFVCAFTRRYDGTPDFIATREYFPDRLRTAIRQKTRWTLGIAFQGTRNLGWRGEWVDRYFMFRDRRGPINAVLLVFGFITLIGFLISTLIANDVPDFMESDLFAIPAALNLISMVVRLGQRVRAVLKVNAQEHAWFVPVRWPVSNLVNTCAAFQAARSQTKSLITGVAPKWDKTKHVIPKGFGQTKVPLPDLEGTA